VARASLPTNTMLGALRARLPCGPPYVDFRDVEEFTACCAATEAAYIRLIYRAVDLHMRHRPSASRFAWTKTDEMLVGVTEFPELREHGVKALLGLTHKRGLRFLLAMNNAIVIAVTVACRTYSDAFMAVVQRDASPHPVDLFCHFVPAVKTHMVRAFQLAFSTRESDGSCLHELYRACFAQMLHPDTLQGVDIPRHRVREYALALACITHARLGCGADGEPLAGQRLHEDTLRLIVGFIDFH